MKLNQEVKKEYLKECRVFGVSIFLCLNFKPRIMNWILPIVIGVTFSLMVKTIEENNVNYEANLKESVRLMNIILKK
jgi:hypothetical protein